MFGNDTKGVKVLGLPAIVAWVRPRTGLPQTAVLLGALCKRHVAITIAVLVTLLRPRQHFVPLPTFIALLRPRPLLMLITPFADLLCPGPPMAALPTSAATVRPDPLVAALPASAAMLRTHPFVKVVALFPWQRRFEAKDVPIAATQTAWVRYWSSLAANFSRNFLSSSPLRRRIYSLTSTVVIWSLDIVMSRSIF
jgi:hypothetical protein